MTGPNDARLTPERFRRIEELFHLARACPPAERASFLAAECASDAALRAEVDALLDEREGTLMRDGVAPVIRQIAAVSPGRFEGRTIGPYVLGPLLGVGGMGEVYRAMDTVLKRAVAVKVLPTDVAADPVHLARFRREAELLAALNHPHIAHLYGLERADGTLALAMELVEGPTLADRIAQGPLPLDDALTIADQIADGLHAAHDQAIIHRDLKPANIKVRGDGMVKILDFGLAKALGQTGAAADASLAPPSSAPPSVRTGAGMLLGTVAYMSPEQLRGQPADRKSDVWAFGCVLYEMLTGCPAFDGDDVAAVTAAIVRDTPDWSKLPPVPASIASLLAGCLEKHPRQRIGNIAVARFVIKEAAHQPAVRLPGRVVTSRAVGRRWLLSTAAIAAVLVAALSFVVSRRTVSPPPAPMRLSAPLGPGVSIRAERGADLAMSRDGTQIAAVAFTERGPQLFVRRLDQPTFVPIAGTVGARMPFFSPDGRWLGYFVEPVMYRVPAIGGTPAVVCEGIDDPLGASWSDDDRIVFGRRSGLWTVAASGGTATPLSPQSGHQWVQVLPGSRAMIFTALHDPDPPDIMVQDLTGGTPKVLVRSAYYGRYAGTGHLLYASKGALYAVPFDPRTLALKGDAVVLVSSVSGTTARGLWSAQYAVSDTGTLVYTSGGAPASMDRSPLTLLTRVGVRSTLFEGLSWRNVAFSPDGRDLAVEAATVPSTAGDIMILEGRTGAPRPLTLDSNNDHSSPVWSPDGRKIAFAARRHGTNEPFNLYWRNADGSGSIHRLTTSSALQFPGGWHPGGKWIVFHEIKKPGAGDIYALPVEADKAGGLTAGSPQAIVDSPEYTEQQPAFSPDGRWIAYMSNERGDTDVFVRPFHGTSGPWKVAAGSFPVWSPGKNELLFTGEFHQVVVARYSASGSTFRVEETRPWPGAVLAAGQFRRLAVAPDGDHIAAGLVDPNADQSVNVVLHMLDALTPASRR